MAVSADLGKQLEEFLDRLVKTGRYRSRSEVIREGLRLVQERESRMAALDVLLQVGLDDIIAGRTRLAEYVFADLRAELLALKVNKRAS